MIMVHAGGWAGHDARAQQLLMDSPGKLLLKRGWRVVSIDYEAGSRRAATTSCGPFAPSSSGETSNGPLCLYGESSGAHLALVAAARLGREIDCVIGLGAPADLPLYLATAANGSARPADRRPGRSRKFFGTSAGPSSRRGIRSSLAPTIPADVLLMREGDDGTVPADQSARLTAAHPRDDDAHASIPARRAFVHGTISAQGPRGVRGGDRVVRRSRAQRNRR